MMDAARACVALGEDLHVVDELPAGITIADDKVAVLHLYEEEEEGAGADVTTLVTRHPGLIEVIGHIFEGLWRASTPVLLQEADRDGRSNEQELLLSYLSTGMKDDAMARALGVSPRTLARRMRELLDDLGVQTRFQAGLKLGMQHPSMGDGQEASADDGG